MEAGVSQWLSFAMHTIILNLNVVSKQPSQNCQASFLLLQTDCKSEAPQKNNSNVKTAGFMSSVAYWHGFHTDTLHPCLVMVGIFDFLCGIPAD